ncbi:ribonuclease G and E [Rhodobacteraceae bacterium HIMB11]|nr:ribonuclease G and E [Rhodobacteraceae bacterium HIMB11]
MDNMAKKMLIDATHAEETRVVVVDGNKVEEFDFESENKRQIAGNIYLAKVTRVEPSLQAAFVDYGGNRHGFLAFSEIHPDYYQIPVADREALMEEERALAEADARAEEEDEAPKKRRRRGPRRRNNKPAEAVTETEVDGMETIDLDTSDESDENDAPMAAPIVEDEPMIVTQEVDAPEESADTDAAEADAPMAETEPDAPSDDAQGDTLEEAPAADASSEETAEEASAASVDEPTAAADTNDDAEAEDNSDEPVDGDTAEDDQDDGIESVSDDDDAMDLRPQRRSRPRRYKIQEVIKVRQIMLVQVVKEERGNKGAALTTYLSLAGRYCVLMPNTARGGGISRKITNVADRKKLKEIATEIDVPTGAGLIIRTAGAKRTKTEIKRDYEYLQRLWEQIRELTLKSIAPAKIYEEGDLIKRSIRDLYNRDIDEVLVEGERGYRNAKDFMKMIMPSHAKNVKHYTDALPLFARYQVESYLSSMFNPVVQLKSGGYLVIGVTEALVAVDVNSGRATKEGSIEETALKTNLEAAEEVARQMRLRDLAGLIVIDFIDMDERRNNNAVEKRLKDKLKTDRARIQVGRISGFGLLEMSRQRLRPGMIEATTQPCPSCHGTGLIRSDDNLALSILRQIEEEGVRRRSREVLVKCPVGISNFIMNQKRDHVAQIEARYGLSVRVEGDPMLVSPDFSIEKFKTATRYVPEAAEPVVSADTIVMDEIDEDITEEDHIETPESEQDDERKPKRRRRRRRRRKGQGGDQAEGSEDQTYDEAVADEDAAADADAGESAEEDAPVEDTAKEEKPKRARRSRKKKTESEEEQPSEEAQPAETSVDEAAAEEEAPKPKRRTRRKKADEVKKEAAQTETPVEAEDAPKEEKPKRKRAPRKTKAQKEAEAAVQAATEAAALEAPAEPAPVAEEAPVVETVPEPKADAPVAEQVEEKPEEPAKTKRRGWWSLKR